MAMRFGEGSCTSLIRIARGVKEKECRLEPVSSTCHHLTFFSNLLSEFLGRSGPSCTLGGEYAKHTSHQASKDLCDLGRGRLVK